MVEQISKSRLAYLLIDSLKRTSLKDKLSIVSMFSDIEEVFDNFEEYEQNLIDILQKEDYDILSETVKDRDKLKSFYNEMKRLPCEVVCYQEEDYPERLYNSTENPPLVIYYRGNLRLLDESNLVLIASSRLCSSYGLDVAKRFATELVEKDVTLISAIADGVDTKVIETALEQSGRIVMFAAGGIDKITPSQNAYLVEEIEKNGLVLSAERPDVVAMRHHYIMRDDYLSACCTCLILVEGTKDSKIVGLVNRALIKYREVFAVPGEITSPHSYLPNKLIAESSAQLIFKAEFVLNEYVTKSMSKTSAKSKIKNGKRRVGRINEKPNGEVEVIVEEKVALDKMQRKVVDLIKRKGSMHIEEIAEELNEETKNLVGVMVILEVQKVVEKTSTNKYKLKD